MAIQISGTTVIDDSRNLSNIANATTAATADTYAIRDAGGNLSAANLTANMSVYTGPGTFTVPPSTTRLKVTVTGGGGNYTVPPLSRNAGAGGGTGIAVINVTPGSSIPLTVGAAGAPGGSSTFGSFVTATGGGEGDAGGTASFPSPAPSYVSQLNIGGQSGFIYTGEYRYRAGGASFWGGNGGPGGAYGSGATIPSPSPSGAVIPARAGVVVVEW
jgi:hypothetical protein